MHSYLLCLVPRVEGGGALSLRDLDTGTVIERALGSDAIDEVLRRTSAGNALSYPDDEGEALYRWLDGSERWLARLTSERAGIALHVEIGSPLADLPWELLGGATHLTTQPATLFTPVRRHADAPSRDAVDPQNRPLRVLFMASSPENVASVLDFEREETRILDATRSQPIELMVEESGTLRGLHERLRDEGTSHFDVVHLTGHAGRRDGCPCFFFEDDRGGAAPASAEDLARAFETAWPRLLFLSGCSTALEVDELPSLCEALIASGAPAVLGWAAPVSDAAATLAAEELYDRLGAGGRVDEAVAAARRKLREGRSRHWPLLRLYADATPLSTLVLPKKTPGRARLRQREARSELIAAGSQMEVCAASAFVGRRRSIQRCLRVLQSREGDEGYAEGVLLHGLGGLGKSSLAARLCDRMPGHKRVVCVGRLDEIQVLRALGEKYPDAAAGLNSDLPLKARLRAALDGPLERSPALFVLDDFEHNLDVGEGGAVLLRPEAFDVIQALVTAIREASSDSRVIVTSRHAFSLSGDPRRSACLAPEALESMRGADLRKKIAQLPNLAGETSGDAHVRARAVDLAAGNPRLLERLERALASGSVDVLPILASMQAAAEELREEIVLDRLVSQQVPACRRMLAQLSVVRLPVDRAAVDAIVSGEVDPHLMRAGEVGLVEVGVAPSTGQPRYAVSGIVEPVLRNVLSEEEWVEAARRAAKWLRQAWSRGGPEERALEIFRLALASGEQEIAAQGCELIARNWVRLSRFREVAQLCQATLRCVQDSRPFYWLARTQEVIGSSDSAKNLYRAALSKLPPSDGTATSPVVDARRGAILDRLAILYAIDGDMAVASRLWDESLVLAEKSGGAFDKTTVASNRMYALVQRGNHGAPAAVLRNAAQIDEGSIHPNERAVAYANAACALLFQKRTAEALGLLDKALVAADETGDLRGRAVVLNSMGFAASQHGHIDKAATLWAESLKIAERVGDVRLSVATLGHLAHAAKRSGDGRGWRNMNREAAARLVTIGAWSDLMLLVHGVATLDDAWAPTLLAQGVWLCTQVASSFERSVVTIRALIERLGPAAELTPYLAAVAFDAASEAKEKHPKACQMEQFFANVLVACAKARGVDEAGEGFRVWFAEQVLGGSPLELRTKLIRDLEALIPDDAWLFDRAKVPNAVFPRP